MRILNITAQKPDSTGSGVYLSELIKGFHQLGHEQALLAGIYPEDRWSMVADVAFYPVHFRTKELPFPICGMSDEMPYVSTRYCDMNEEMTVQFREAYSGRIKEALEEFEPEIILCHHLYYVTGLVRECAPETPLYVVCHGSDLRQIKKNPWQREYIKSQIAKVDGVFALHGEQKQEICRVFSLPQEKVKVIGTGFNHEIFCIQKERRGQRSGQEIQLIFAGKLSEKKGVMSLLRSLNALEQKNKSYRLVLAGGYGNEAEYEEIKALAGKTEIEVEFAGKLNQYQLAEKMNESDMFILPSFYEGLPLVVVEAMACGLKVVCTDLPGIANWLGEKVPHHNVRFIKPPKMENEDEPAKEDLPIFEHDLAQCIDATAEDILKEREGKQENIRPELTGLSWSGLCERLLEQMKEMGV